MVGRNLVINLEEKDFVDVTKFMFIITRNMCMGVVYIQSLIYGIFGREVAQS